MRQVLKLENGALRALLAMLAMWFAGPAHAYIGPGAGLGVIMVTVALVLGVALLLFGFVWYPLRRLMRRRKESQVEDQQ